MLKQFLLCLPFLLLACSKPSTGLKVHHLSGKTMGTTYNVKFVAPESYSADKVKVTLEEALQEVNRQMSTYIKDSEISRLNRAQANKPFRISPWFAKTLQASLHLAQKTEGFFDPTVGPLVNLWGFGPSGEKKVPSPSQIAATKSYVGYEKLQLKKSEKDLATVIKAHGKVYVDLSASAKGFAVDVLSEKLQEAELRDHLVEIGGEIRSSGRKMKTPWSVAIEKPNHLGRSVQQLIQLNGLSLATSGSYRNFYKSNGKSYSHSIDRSTGRPIEHQLISVSVLEENCLEADALATALMVMGPERGLQFARKNKLAAYFIIASEAGKKIKTEMTPAFSERGGVQ